MTGNCPNLSPITAQNKAQKVDGQHGQHGQKVAILGATGSIGTSTLDILSRHDDKYDVYALSGHSRLDELFQLCVRWRPKRVAVPKWQVDAFAQRLSKADLRIDVVAGQAGLDDIACDPQVDTVVAAIVGSAGLSSTLMAVQAGKRVLLANKEALVMAGSLMMHHAKLSGAKILPVDSEHNAIFQCLPQTVQQNQHAIHDKHHGISQLWLTASGGPFLSASFDEMQSATVEQAVKHPNWSMGQKISVDSATMMNKGLELIEACYLFDLPEDKIQVVMHPQSIVHSLVQYADGSFLAQMGSPDMRTPIAHVLSFPERIDSGVVPLNLYELGKLEFLPPDLHKFKCLALAREAMRAGSWATISLNAVNEVAVQAFLDGHIRLTDIANMNENVLNSMSQHQYPNEINDLASILAIDNDSRVLAKHNIEKNHMSK